MKRLQLVNYVARELCVACAYLWPAQRHDTARLHSSSEEEEVLRQVDTQQDGSGAVCRRLLTTKKVEVKPGLMHASVLHAASINEMAGTRLWPLFSHQR